ncbi:MAG: Spy/CpxP family protein refolding chaperone [Campylobacterota bacterium]|nr:Spy/CpxP family protein refolding chaperone [Campylobacterota bacterium]
MNTKIILSLGAAALLTSALYAYGSNKSMKEGCQNQNKSHKMMMKKGSHHKKGGNIMKMVQMLDLTADQKVKIQDIAAQNQKNRLNPHSAFSATGFDKAKFVEISKEKRDGKIERKAQTIDKIYAVLTAQQKKNLKTLLDMKAMKMQKMQKMQGKKMMKHGGNGGSNCNGRG